MNGIGFSFGAISQSATNNPSSTNATDNKNNSDFSFEALFGMFDTDGDSQPDTACMEMECNMNGQSFGMAAFLSTQNTQTDNSAATNAVSSTSSDSRVDSLLSKLEEMIKDVEMMMLQGNDKTQHSVSAASILGANSTTDSSPAEQALASNGPLPQFLEHVVAAKHLNHTQQVALYQIAQENLDSSATGQDMVSHIHDELAQAGIDETPV